MTDIYGNPEPCRYVHVPVYSYIDRPRDDLPFPHLEPELFPVALTLLYGLSATLYALGLVSFLRAVSGMTSSLPPASAQSLP